MPGPILHVGAGMTCPHGGTVQVAPGNPRVALGTAFAATMSDAFAIAGCPFQVPVPGGTKPQPCVRVQWTVPPPPVSRVVAGAPVILQTSTGVCMSAEGIPQGAPIVSVVQPRVVAS